MASITVKNNYQLAIPRRVFAKIGVTIGDVLEARVERGRITLTPKSAVDSAIAEGLADVREGRVHGPFDTVEEMLTSLKAQAKMARKRSRQGR